MATRTVMIGVISALLGFCLAVVVTNATSAQTQGPFQHGDLIDDTTPAQSIVEKQKVGRFQAVSHGSALYLIDTATGRGWKLQPDNWPLRSDDNSPPTQYEPPDYNPPTQYKVTPYSPSAR